MRRSSILLLLIALVVPGAARAQSLTATKEPPPQKAGREQPVPKRYLPPAGMCRIWVDNVPAARQPAPTDCATAIRNRPPNARVIFPAGSDGKAKAPARPDTVKRKPPA